jgi:hypothetical protein
MNLKKALFVLMVSVITLPAIASAKPQPKDHNVTPAMRSSHFSHFAKWHFGR